MKKNTSVNSRTKRDSEPKLYESLVEYICKESSVGYFILSEYLYDDTLTLEERIDLAALASKNPNKAAIRYHLINYFKAHNWNRPLDKARFIQKKKGKRLTKLCINYAMQNTKELMIDRQSPEYCVRVFREIVARGFIPKQYVKIDKNLFYYQYTVQSLVYPVGYKSQHKELLKHARGIPGYVGLIAL